MLGSKTIVFPSVAAALLSSPAITVHFTGKRTVATEAVSPQAPWEFFGQDGHEIIFALKSFGFQQVTEFPRDKQPPENLASLWMCPGEDHLPNVYVELYNAEGYRQNVEFHNRLGKFMTRVIAGQPA